MGHQLPELVPYVLLAGCEGRVPLAAVLFRHPCKIVDAADMKDCCNGSLLLFCTGNAFGDGLNCNAFGLAYLQVTCRLLIVRANGDRVPGAIGPPLSHG